MSSSSSVAANLSLIIHQKLAIGELAMMGYDLYLMLKYIKSLAGKVLSDFLTVFSIIH
jgi:hypothetical protein